jgi:hypothetical protein
VTLAAEKGEEKIAVEVQSFLSLSPLRDLEEAVGQYQVYRILLARKEPERLLYMAVPRGVHQTLLSDQFGQLIITELKVRLLVFDARKGRVIRWIS